MWAGRAGRGAAYWPQASHTIPSLRVYSTTASHSTSATCTSAAAARTRTRTPNRRRIRSCPPWALPTVQHLPPLSLSAHSSFPHTSYDGHITAHSRVRMCDGRSPSPRSLVCTRDRGDALMHGPIGCTDRGSGGALGAVYSFITFILHLDLCTPRPILPTMVFPTDLLSG